MKKLLLFIFVLTLLNSCKGQSYFSGEIMYSVSFGNVDPQIDINVLKQIFGESTTFSFENGYFLQLYKNSSIDFDYLDPISKVYYRKYSGNDTLYQYDATTNDQGDVIEMNIEEGNIDIIGYECDKLILKTKERLHGIEYTMTFYFAQEINIDKGVFKDIEYSNANLVYGKTESIPLKIEICNPYFCVIITAIKVTEKKGMNLNEIFQTKIVDLITKK